MRPLAAILSLFVVASMAIAQDAEPKPATTIHSLTLRPNGPPVPSFRYELLTPHRDQNSNNAALLHHRALHVLTDNKSPAKEHYEMQEKFSKALEGAPKDFPKEEVR